MPSCIVPDEYKNETVRVMVRPAYDRLEIIPAEYKNRGTRGNRSAGIKALYL